MAKRKRTNRPQPTQLKSPDPSVKEGLVTRFRIAVIPFVAVVLPVVTITSGYLISRPSVDYTITLATPLAANQTIKVDGFLKNYGNTPAYRSDIVFKIALPSSDYRPHPNFNDTLDSLGHRRPPAAQFDLGAGQQTTMVTFGPPQQFIDQAKYSELVTGKTRLLVFTQVYYKDWAHVSHTKYGCRKYVPGLGKNLVQCSVEDWMSP